MTMDSITISGAAICTTLGVVWQFAKIKAEHAARMATMEQRIISLEARAKHVDASLEGEDKRGDHHSDSLHRVSHTRQSS